MSDTPTVVLVHGAFADASSFGRVIPDLLTENIPVLAPAGEGALGNSNTARLAIGSLVSGRPGARSGSAGKPRGSPSARRPGAAPVAHPG